MQSPFEAVKSVTSIFRAFSHLLCRKSQVGSIVAAPFSPVYYTCSRNCSTDSVKGRKKLCCRSNTIRNGKEKDYVNDTYPVRAREGSLFEFASSSTLIWPPISNNNATGKGGDASPPPARKSGGQIQQKRFLWGWLNSIFNRVDDERIKEVGPDRACAEWLLRCGAGVKWDNGPDEWLRDYNSLPVGNYRTLKIVEIDATDSAIMHIGFAHFRGLKNVRKAKFHRCGYLEDEGVRQLGFLKNTLEDLQISSCGNVTDEGILTLVQMKNLKRMKLYDFLEVRNRRNCISVLQQSLPNCQIVFPFARESDRDAPIQLDKEEKT